MHRDTIICGSIVFLVSLFIYLLTLAPSVSFWDCGEFIASAYTLGVPHPPGAPLYLLIGRLFTMLPFADVAYRMNFISALCTAGTILFTFLIIVEFLHIWRGEPRTASDRYVLLASGSIGSLSFAFTDTLWFNATEAEVYAMSLFLMALVLWLGLVWMKQHQEYHSTRYILFAIYLFGLGAGVHLLNLLVIPTLLIFIYFTQRRLFMRIDLWTFLPIFVLLGYSVYIMILIRSGLDPVIDENNPENWTNFLKYLNREQYLEESQLAGFLNRNAPLWEYQIKKMFLRYFGWQYLGKGTTIGEDGYIAEIVSLHGLSGFPFILGIFGAICHFFKDWKRAFGLAILFFMTGLALVIYLNQPSPQPRERDYVYVGHFFTFAIWIGIGMGVILEAIFGILKTRNATWVSALLFTAIVLVTIPVRLLQTNYHSHDRSQNYIARDYAYNLLINCEPNSLLFTNGDNDTFPLWYLQEVEGIRKDVRVICLALLNTDWYISQLKHRAPQVPIPLTDPQIQQLTHILWDQPRTIRIPVAPEDQRRYIPEMASFISFNESPFDLSINVEATYNEKALRVQDQMVLSIIMSNRWQRPIYFAVTVAPESFLGLEKYFRLDGMVYKLIPAEGIRRVYPALIEPFLFEQFRYTGLNDSSLYIPFGTQMLLQNYRNAFLNTAYTQYHSQNADGVIHTLDMMEFYLPESLIMIPDTRIIEQIGRLYYNVGRGDELEKRMQYILQNRNPDMGQLHDFAIQYYQLFNNIEMAHSVVDYMLTQSPNHPKALGLKVALYEQEQNYDPAIALLKALLQRNPSNKDAASKLSELEHKKATTHH